MLDRLPTKIKILGFTFKITYTNDPNLLALDNRICTGVCDSHANEIHISTRTQGIESQLQTLMHEIVHAIERKFDERGVHTKLTEFQIDMLATGLASILIDLKNIEFSEVDAWKKLEGEEE